jgi:hypothetical protein
MIGNLKRKWSLERPVCRWEDNVKMDFIEGMRTVRIAQDRDE